MRQTGWGHRPQRNADLERGRQMSGHAHRLDVLGLVVEQLAQLHGHQVLSAGPGPVKACQSDGLSAILATSGCSSTSAQGGLRSHPQLGSPLGAPAPLLGSLRLRVRRLRGGYNWPGLEARGARVGQSIPRRGEPGPPLSSRGASGVLGQPGSSRPHVRGR